MSQENVEVIKRANAALNAGDIEAALNGYSPDVTLRDLLNGPDQPTVVKGVDAIRQAWSLWIEAFDELRADVDEFSTLMERSSVPCAGMAGQGEWHVDRRAPVRRLRVSRRK